MAIFIAWEAPMDRYMASTILSTKKIEIHSRRIAFLSSRSFSGGSRYP